MSEKELKMIDVDAQLDAVFGIEGTPERKAAEDRANAFFTGQIIEEARKKIFKGQKGFLDRLLDILIYQENKEEYTQMTLFD